MMSIFRFLMAGFQYLCACLRQDYDGSSEIGREYREEFFTRSRTDKEALRSDMRRVSEDMKNAWAKVVEMYG